LVAIAATIAWTWASANALLSPANRSRTKAFADEIAERFSVRCTQRRQRAASSGWPVKVDSSLNCASSSCWSTAARRSRQVERE